MKAPFPTNICVGRCNALRWRLQCFALADAMLCDGGCKALRWRMQSFAMAHAMLCVSGCNALRLKMAKLAQKPYVLFRIKEKGGKIHNMGHCCPKGNYSRTNKASVLGAI